MSVIASTVVVPRHAHAAKGVADDQITAVVIEPRKAQSAVVDAYLNASLGSRSELVWSMRRPACHITRLGRATVSARIACGLIS